MEEKEEERKEAEIVAKGILRNQEGVVATSEYTILQQYSAIDTAGDAFST